MRNYHQGVVGCYLQLRLRIDELFRRQCKHQENNYLRVLMEIPSHDSLVYR